jgi:hypothetical protein
MQIAKNRAWLTRSLGVSRIPLSGQTKAGKHIPRIIPRMTGNSIGAAPVALALAMRSPAGEPVRIERLDRRGLKRKGG